MEDAPRSARTALEVELDETDAEFDGTGDDADAADNDEVEGGELEDDWVEVERGLMPQEAHVIRGILRGADIESRLWNENTVATNWFLLNATGGVRVVVRASELAHAREVLAAVVAESNDAGNAEDSGDGSPEP